MEHPATSSWMCLAIAGIALAGAHTAPAQASGINLSWDDCGAAGVDIQQFACDSNTGTPFEFIGSFVPPEDITQCVGLSAQVEIQLPQRPDVSDWWALAAGRCRAGSLSVSFDFTNGPYTCTDVFLGQAAGGYIYEPGPRVNQTQIRIQATVPSEFAVGLKPNTEYYAFRVRIQRAKASGTGACAGCGENACILFREIQLFQPPEQGNDPRISNPLDRQFIGWQGPGCAPTPITRMSLGELKCRYR